MESADWYRERRGSAPLSQADKAIIIADYNAITGGNFHTDFKPTCPNRYSDAIDKILLIMTRETTSGYVLKRGVVFRYKGKIINNQNLTNEAAEWYIGQDFNHRDNFETLAKDYDSYEPKSETKGAAIIEK